MNPANYAGFNGTIGVSRVCSITSGDTITFEFREWPNLENPGSIDPSHKGPCAVYMKKTDDPTTDQGYGDGWFKIWEQGYDSKRRKWCTEDLITNNGFMSVQMPSDLRGGYYMIRPELIALHQADNTPPDPQFHIGCAQIYLKSSGGIRPATVSIPGYIAYGSSSLDINIYQRPLALPYIMAGPPVYLKASSSENEKRAMEHIQTLGLEPSGCIAYNANWCGTEPASYTDEDGCWAASENCYEQVNVCYDTAPPTGNTGCVAYETHCAVIQKACFAGKFKGPPKAGVLLTPKSTLSSYPPAASTGLAIGNIDGTAVAVSSSYSVAQRPYTLSLISTLIASAKASSSISLLLAADVATKGKISSSDPAIDMVTTVVTIVTTQVIPAATQQLKLLQAEASHTTHSLPPLHDANRWWTARVMPNHKGGKQLPDNNHTRTTALAKPTPAGE